MADTKTILKYLKVKALADRGDPGERDNARRILAKLTEDHPGIEADARRYQAEQEGEDPYPSGVWQGNGSHRSADHRPGAGNWEEIFNFARGVVNQAYDFAQTAANAYAGRILAEEYVESSTRSTRSGNVLISLKMSLPVYNQAGRLNYVQRQAFRQAMHEMLEEELDAMLGEDD
jgi:hypothetical protein